MHGNISRLDWAGISLWFRTEPDLPIGIAGTSAFSFVLLPAVFQCGYINPRLKRDVNHPDKLFFSAALWHLPPAFRNDHALPYAVGTRASPLFDRRAAAFLLPLHLHPGQPLRNKQVRTLRRNALIFDACCLPRFRDGLRSVRLKMLHRESAPEQVSQNNTVLRVLSVLYSSIMAGGLSLPPLEWDVWLILVTLRYRANVFQRDLRLYPGSRFQPLRMHSIQRFFRIASCIHIGAACFTVLRPVC